MFDSLGHLKDGMFYPISLAFDAAGDMYAATAQSRVFDAAGNLIYVSPGGCSIMKMSGRVWSTVAGNGVCDYTGDGGAATGASLNHPDGIAVDGAGDLYIADRDNSRVRVVYGVGATVWNADADGIPAYADNCPTVYNPDQTNTDGNNAALGRSGQDALGDACDPDISGDGYGNAAKQALGKNLLVYCPIIRADVDGDGTVSILDLARDALKFGQTVTQATERLNQDADNVISILDLAKMASVFGKPVTQCP